MERIDVAVIGAGVTGLASARAIAQRGLSVCVLERHPRAGLDTSTHNSGVIHAGLYYPEGSLKARLCVEGARLMYEFCARHGVPHVHSGKLVVAHDDTEVPTLEALRVRGAGNGVRGLEIVDRDFIAAREPAVSAVAALWSPDSGIVEAEAFVGADRDREGLRIRTGRETILAHTVVNAAGLYADDVSRILGGESLPSTRAAGSTRSSCLQSDRL